MLPFNVVKAIQKIATDCEASAQLAAQRLEGTPAIYFRQGKNIWPADVDPRLDGAVASICERQRVAPMEHTSTDVEIYVDRALAENLCKGGKISLPVGRQLTRRGCPPLTHVFTGRTDILTKCGSTLF